MMQNTLRSSRTAILRPSTSTFLKRTYADIQNPDPSLHPSGANREAAKDLGPIADSPLPEMSKHTDKSKAPAESNTATMDEKHPNAKPDAQPQPEKGTTSSETRKKTIAELDEELRQKLSGHDDGGGAAGVEYENGVAVTMKRGVRNNMFRYI